MRTSPVYYLAPSSISIIPNCNGTASDLAVTIARGTKLKIYYPPIFALGTVDGNYQEWTLAGRNRRLADDTAPYTIYARLRMAEDPTSAASLATAHANGYLVFAKQTKDADDNWTDPYILSPNPSSTSPLNNVIGADGKKYSWPPIPAGQAQNGRTGYWWLKLGVVSVPENGERTVTLDTGILGTDQYNVDWYLNSDNLPERPVREIQVDRKEWTASPKDTYTGETGSTAPDGTLDMDVASKLGWTGTEVLSFTQGQEIDEPYHCRSLTRNRWLTQRLDIRNSGYNDKELYERLTSPARGWEEENWVETSRVWHDSGLWECQTDGTTDEPSKDSTGWRLLMRSKDGSDITVIHDREFYASPTELSQAQLKAIAEASWSKSTPADYSAVKKYLYARDTARYYKNGAEQTVTVGGISYPHIVYNLMSYWGQDGSGVEFAYYRANDDSAANKPSVSVLNQRHPGTAKNPVIADWSGSDGGWYDDNPGFTAQGQVMYQSVNKYSNGTWSGWDTPVIIDRYATNSVRLALDNEHEDFLYDGSRLVAPSAGASSPIRLYDGGKDITSSMPAPEIHSVSGTTNGTGGAYISNKTLYVKALTAATCEVVVKCVYNGTAYYAKFTANKTNQDKYDLVCKPSSVAYNSTTHAAKSAGDTIQTVSLSATGIGIGGTSLSPSLSTSVGAGRLCVFWAPVSSSGTVGSFSDSPVTSKAVTKLECETYAGIYFELRYYTSASDYRVCDYETVEIAKTKDGDNGKDAKYIYIRGTGLNNNAERKLNITSTTNVISEYGWACRGLVVARIDRYTLAVSGITWFDVYGGSSEGGVESDANANTARTKFVTYLTNTTSDYFLAVASQDAIGLNDAMVAKLREFGLGKLDYTAVSGVGGFRTPFAFLGYKGLQQGYALYQLQGTGENDPYAEVMAYVSNGIFMSSKDGDDAVNYDIVFTEAWAKATRGTISARLRGHAYKIESNNRTPLAYATIRYGYNPEDNETYADTTTGNDGYFDEDTWFDGDGLDDYAKGSPAVFASIIIDGKAVCTKFVTIVQEADDGKPGHVGRWYYYAGDWASGATYTMQETQAPFVKRGDNFYMLDYGTSGAATGTTQLDPASNYNPVSGQGSKPWTLMQSTMQYYIAQAFFGPYAHFGSFIINGDWMISQYGTLVYSSGTTITVNASNVNTKYSSDAPIVLNGNNTGNGIIVYKVSFNVSSSTTINITLTTSSENNYDFGAVGTVDNDSLLSATYSSIKNGTSATSLKASGSNTVSTSISLNAGSHYLYIGYFKDSSANSGNDNASFSISGATYNLTEAKKTSGMSMSGGSKSVVPYGWFDPADPEVKTLPASGYKFRPNFAVDGLTGKTYQNDAYVRGEITATGGSITGYLDVTGGLNVKNSGGNTIVQVNGDDLSKTATDAKTIVDAGGFYVKRGNEGFRLTTNGFQRYNPSAYQWVNFYGGRYAKIVSLYSGQTIRATKDDDLIIVRAYSDSNTYLYFPSGTDISDGKVFSIINAGTAAFKVHGDDKKIIGDMEYNFVTLNRGDRMEFVYVDGKWYVTYMPFVHQD